MNPKTVLPALLCILFTLSSCLPACAATDVSPPPAAVLGSIVDMGAMLYHLPTHLAVIVESNPDLLRLILRTPPDQLKKAALSGDVPEGISPDVLVQLADDPSVQEVWYSAQVDQTLQMNGTMASTGTGGLQVAASLNAMAGANTLGSTDPTTTIETALVNATQVAGGMYHTVALKEDGTVWAWGYNRYGQLGNGTSVDRATPAPVSGLAGVEAVACGLSHSLALKAGGTVWAWGRNNHGQLGDGTQLDKAIPVQISGLTDVTAVACGSTFSLALKEDGTVWAWGDDGIGQLGSSGWGCRITPIQISGLAGIRAIAAGGTHGLALQGDGTVWAWGGNYYGQLGNGVTCSDYGTAPCKVTGLTGVAAISAGGYHSLALKEDGTVWAYGYNYEGQLGDGTEQTRLVPVQVSGLTGVEAIACGQFHSVALRQDRTVCAWGYNRYGQLGDGAATDSALPTQVIELANATAVACGLYHSLALGAQGTVLAWGDDYYGQLGDGTMIYKSVPIQVTGLTNVRLVCGGAYHSLALEADNTAWTWGNNASGELGDGTRVQRATPIQPGGLTGVTAIAGGSCHSLAVKTDGSVWAWGANDSGRLGDGTIAQRATPVQISLAGMQVVAAGSAHSLALKGDGTVWSWGENSYYELGRSERWYYCSTPGKVNGLTGIRAIACGGYFSLALKTDGTVWSWGGEAHGELGNGTIGEPQNPSIYAVLNPTQVAGLTGVEAIACGTHHSLALKTDGTVWAWGLNTTGQLGNGTTTTSPYAQQVSELTGVIAIACGGSHSLALKADGTVFAWGGNYCGQLGDGTETDRLTPEQVVGLAGVAAIGAGGGHSFALKTDGTVWAWGDNHAGQLGSIRVMRSSCPMATYGTPPNLVATPASDRIALAYGVTGGATSYDLEIDSTIVNNGTNRSYTHTGLAVNSAHTYRARCVSELGPGNWSELRTICTLANPPSDSVISGATSYSLGVSWQANGNPAGTEYALAAFSPDGTLARQNTWTTSLSDTLTSLSASTQYTIRVKARNGNNIETSWLEVGTGATHPIAPAPPQNLSASPFPDQVALSWGASTGASVYYVYDDGIEIAQTEGLTFDHTGLLPESSHVYTIKAWNPGGFSAPTAELIASTLPVPPATPSDVTALPAPDAVTVSWSAVSGATGYQIECDNQVISAGVSTSYTHVGLMPGTVHTYRIRAQKSEVYGDWSSAISSYTLLSAPATVTASASDTRITLWWSPVDGASGYEVSIDGTPSSTSATSYVSDGLAPGIVHTYRVRAVSSMTVGAWSPERTKSTLCSPPAVPLGLSGTPDQTSVSIGWDSVVGATSYDLEMDGVTFGAGSLSSYEVTGLAPGSSHTYRVRARNAGGKSDWSNPLTISTLLLGPNVPGNLRATSAVDSIVVEWDSVSPASQYELEIDGAAPVVLTAQSYLHSGLEPASTHSYRVRSVSAGAPSDWSPVTITHTKSNSYPTPANLQGTAVSTSVALTWDAVTGVLGYDVEADGEVIGDITATSYTHSELSPETAHSYRIRTVNEGGVRGDWSSFIVIGTLPGAPEPPAEFTVVAGTDHIVLSWDSIPDASGYRVRVGDGEPVLVTDSVHDQTGLTAETQYTFTVQTLAGALESAWSGPITAATLSNRPPVPTNLTAVASSSSVRLSWTIANGATSYEARIDNGSPISVYDNTYLHDGLAPEATHTYAIRGVYVDTPGDWSAPVIVTTLPNAPAAPANVASSVTSNSVTISWDAVAGATSYEVDIDGQIAYQGTATSHTATGLAAGTQHSVTVRAKNAGGTSPWTSRKVILTAPEQAGSPANLAGTSTTNGVAISWGQVSGALGYDVEVDGIVVSLPDVLTYTDQGLSAGTQHAYRVRARIDSGAGVWSPTITVATLLSTPSTFSAQGDVFAVTLSWSAVDNATMYDIEADGTLVAVGLQATTFTHDDLLVNTAHSYRLRARNLFATSDWSPAIVAETSSPSVTISCSEGEVLDLAVVGGNLRDVATRVFTIVYSPAELELVDVCSTTPKPDLAVGHIEGTDITVTRCSIGSQGIIVFTVANPVPADQSLNGVLVVLRFRAKAGGDTVVTYNIK